MTREKIEAEAEFIFTKMTENIGEPNTYGYWQGRLDSLAWMLRQMTQEVKS
jgi:hypothetical protein